VGGLRRPASANAGPEALDTWMGQRRPIETEGWGRPPSVGRAPGEGNRAAVRVRASRRRGRAGAFA
jgi:hypothetical protein